MIDKTTSSDTFKEEATIESGINTQIIFDKIVIDNNNAAVLESGVSLTLQGINYFSIIDFSVI